MEVSAPAGDPHQELFEEIDALNRKGFISRFRTNPLKPDLRQHQRRVGYFLREWSIEIDSLIAVARQFRGVFAMPAVTVPRLAEAICSLADLGLRATK